MREEEGEGED